MNPHQVAAEMEKCLIAMDELVDEMRKAGVELAASERAYKTEFAKVRLRARASGQKLTVDAVNDQATVATEEALFSYTIAQNTMTICRESLRVQQAKLDALRSMNASIRGAGG